MNDQSPAPHEPTVEPIEADAAERGATEPTRTGVPEVDAVLERVEGVAREPVDEHVAVFDRAHDDLRRALDGAGND